MKADFCIISEASGGDLYAWLELIQTLKGGNALGFYAPRLAVGSV